MSDWQNDALDSMLRSTLRARPEPAAPSNLTHRAMELARAEQRAAGEELARLRRFQFFNRLITVAAVLLITTALYFAGMRIYQRASDFLADQTTSEDTTTVTTTTTTSTETINGIFLAVLAIGVCATVIVFTRATERDDESMLRFG